MIYKKIECLKIAISDYLKHGTWVQHLYEEVEETPAIIIATENSFRVSDNYQHEPNETVYPNATLIRCRCVRCGHEMFEWKNNNKNMPIMYDSNREE